MSAATIALSEDQVKLLDGVMKFKQYEKRTDALQYVCQVFTSRFNALRNYDKAQKAGAKPAKKAAKKTAKKAAKKAAPKAASKVE